MAPLQIRSKAPMPSITEICQRMEYMSDAFAPRFRRKFTLERGPGPLLCWSELLSDGLGTRRRTTSPETIPRTPLGASTISSGFFARKVLVETMSGVFHTLLPEAQPGEDASHSVTTRQSSGPLFSQRRMLPERAKQQLRRFQTHQTSPNADAERSWEGTWRHVVSRARLRWCGVFLTVHLASSGSAVLVWKMSVRHWSFCS